MFMHSSKLSPITQHLGAKDLQVSGQLGLPSEIQSQKNQPNKGVT